MVDGFGRDEVRTRPAEREALDSIYAEFDEAVGDDESEHGEVGEVGPGGEVAVAAYPQFRRDPAEWVRSVVGAEPAEYQVEFLESVRDDPQVALKGCRGAGKSTSLAWAILWWLTTRAMSRVQILAPTKERQLSQFLLPECEKWVERSIREIPVEVLGTKVVVLGHEQRWNAVASQATDPEKIEGMHGRHVMIIVDEARGVDQEVVDALYGTQTDPEGDRCFVMASKPGGESGPFYDAFNSKADLWTRVSVDAYRAAEAGIVSEAWIDERRIDWGEDSALFKQEVLGEFAEDAENAPWDRDMIAEPRLPILVDSDDRVGMTRRQLVRAELGRRQITLRDVVVGVDPSGTKGGDEAGIVVCGRGPCLVCDASGQTDHGFVLEDVSGQLSPDEWAREAVDAFHRWDANAIVAERNFGADMVEQTIAADREASNVPIYTVHAKKGRALRFQPVSRKYERGEVHHVGNFGDLENQMCGWDAEENRTGSPDRVDGMVYSFYELFPLRRSSEKREIEEARRGTYSIRDYSA